jgi:hypothetical protein
MTAFSPKVAKALGYCLASNMSVTMAHLWRHQEKLLSEWFKNMTISPNIDVEDAEDAEGSKDMHRKRSRACLKLKGCVDERSFWKTFQRHFEMAIGLDG